MTNPIQPDWYEKVPYCSLKCKSRDRFMCKRSGRLTLVCEPAVVKMFDDVSSKTLRDIGLKQKKRKKPKNESKSIGGHARSESLSPERRSEIARKAAQTRWNNQNP